MPYTSFLRWGIIGGLCFIPFIPFLVADGSLLPGMFFPYITGKNFTFRILVEGLLILYTILAIREPKYRPKVSLIMWTLAAFVLWMGVATLFSVDPIKSFWSNFERMEGYVSLIHLFALFVIAGAVLTAERWWEKFFRFSIALSILQATYAIFQVFHIMGFTPTSQSGARADTTFGNATYLAVFMLFHIFLTLFMLLRDRRSQGLVWFYGVALVFQFAALFYTETRGAVLGLVGGLIVTALYIALRARGEEWKKLRKVAFGGLGTIVILAGLFFAVKDTTFIRNTPTLSRLASISLEDPTTQSRFIIWSIAFEGFKEKPITGWGQENFNFVFNAHYDPAMYGQEQWFDRAHNEFLDWLIAGGLPAFLLYITLFLLVAWAIIRSELSIPEQAVFLGLLTGYAFNNIFVFDNLLSSIYFFLVLAFAHSLSWKPIHGWMFLSKVGDEKMVAIVAPIAAVVIIAGGWMLNGSGAARAQTLITALQSVNPQTGAAYAPEDRLAAFETALSQGNLGYQEVVEQLFQFTANAVIPSPSVNPETKQNALVTTRTAGENILAQRPNDARLELFMSILFTQAGQYEEALARLNRALELSPNKQQILFQLGSLHLARGDTATAISVFKKAFDLAPSFVTARVLYAGALHYAGQKAEADALLIEVFGTAAPDNEQLLQIYTNTKQFDRVIGIWQARVEKNPDNTDTQLGLASAYFQAGRIAETIATLRKVSQIDPSQAAQVQSIITQIGNGTLKPGQ